MGHRGAEHPRAVRADHQRRAGRPRAARQELAVAHLVPASVEVDGAFAQERADDRERLLEAVDAVVVRVAVGAELGLVPARAEAEDEPAATQLVDRGGLLGEQRRVVEVGAGDERPELDPRRRGGDRGQQRPRLPRAASRPILPAIEEVLADPDGIEPEVLDRAGHVEELGPADFALDLGELDADFERAAGGGGHVGSVAGQGALGRVGGGGGARETPATTPSRGSRRNLREGHVRADAPVLDPIRRLTVDGSRRGGDTAPLPRHVSSPGSRRRSRAQAACAPLTTPRESPTLRRNARDHPHHAEPAGAHRASST